jgi:2-dehydro-3-deoxygalactonokinase
VTAGATALVALDWGTSSARAYRLGHGGQILGRREAPLGIRNLSGSYPAALGALLGDWIDAKAPRLACGMIGSRQGWVEAPYVDCPAPLSALAGALARADGGALSIVPGVACRDADGVPDVMRGEETQVAGALATDAERTLAILPGTHSKWVVAERGTIRAFATFMTGEAYQVLREHSILGRMAEAESGAFDAGAFGRGVRRGAADGASGALLHRLFGARTLALTGDLAPKQVADYLSGLLLGAEIAAGREWAARQGGVPERALVVGEPALCDRYTAALAEAGFDAERGPNDAAAAGLWRIARAAGIVR